jgi:hypothetical protein
MHTLQNLVSDASSEPHALQATASKAPSSVERQEMQAESEAPTGAPQREQALLPSSRLALLAVDVPSTEGYGSRL